MCTLRRSEHFGSIRTAVVVIVIIIVVIFIMKIHFHNENCYHKYDDSDNAADVSRTCRHTVQIIVFQAH